jgi:hypothetical protein
LFTAALGLGGPWRVTDAEFAEDTGRLDLHVDPARYSVRLPGAIQALIRSRVAVDPRHLADTTYPLDALLPANGPK